MFFITVNETHARELVNGGVLIELLLLIGKATHRNIFDIYLNTLTRIGHLFIRFGLIGWLCQSLRKQSQPFEDSIKALDAAGITMFAKSVPKLGKTELWIAPPHISDEFQLIRRMLVGVVMRTL